MRPSLEHSPPPRKACGLCRDASEEGVRVNISQLTPSLHFGSLENNGYRVCLRDGGFIVETEASEKVQWSSVEGQASIQEGAWLGRGGEELSPCEEKMGDDRGFGERGEVSNRRWIHIETGGPSPKRSRGDRPKTRAVVWALRRAMTIDWRRTRWRADGQPKIAAPYRQTRRLTECKVNICKMCVWALRGYRNTSKIPRTMRKSEGVWWNYYGSIKETCW
jgi:hypothetical protein